MPCHVHLKRFTMYTFVLVFFSTHVHMSHTTITREEYTTHTIELLPPGNVTSRPPNMKMSQHTTPFLRVHHQHIDEKQTRLKNWGELQAGVCSGREGREGQVGVVVGKKRDVWDRKCHEDASHLDPSTNTPTRQGGNDIEGSKLMWGKEMVVMPTGNGLVA